MYLPLQQLVTKCDTVQNFEWEQIFLHNKLPSLLCTSMWIGWGEKSSRYLRTTIFGIELWMCQFPHITICMVTNHLCRPRGEWTPSVAYFSGIEYRRISFRLFIVFVLAGVWWKTVAVVKHVFNTFDRLNLGMTLQKRCQTGMMEIVELVRGLVRYLFKIWIKELRYRVIFKLSHNVVHCECEFLAWISFWFTFRLTRMRESDCRCIYCRCRK